MKRPIRVLLSILALAFSGCLLLEALIGAPSFWWLIADGLLVIAALGGLFSSAVFAGVAIPALAAITIGCLPLGLWHMASVLLFLVPVGFLWAGAILAAYFSAGQRAALWKGVAVSSFILAAGFGVDRSFTNKVQVHSYEMQWAIGGDGPVGGPAQEKGETRVVIYRHDSGAICYDAIYSSELAGYLAQKNKSRVHVEYETFYDFGKERAYNVRSIDGKLITKDAYPVLHTAGSEGGTIEISNPSGACDR